MTPFKFSLTLESPLKKGDLLYLCSAKANAPLGAVKASSAVPALCVGERLVTGNAGFQVQSVGWIPGGTKESSERVYLLKALQDADGGEFQFTVESHGYSVAWITLSDKGSVGERTDEDRKSVV